MCWPTLTELEEIEKEFSNILNDNKSLLLNLDKEVIYNLINVKDLKYIEKELGVIIFVDKENKSVSLIDNNGFLIWEIKPWNYWKNHEIQHLYKYVLPEYRDKWLWTLIYNIYKEYIWIPKTEVSSKISSIRFLLKHWYKLDSKLVWTEFVKDWIEEDLSKIMNIDYNIDTNDDLWIIYKLVLEK